MTNESLDERAPLLDSESNITLSLFQTDDKQSPISCVFNFVNFSLGSGVLALPYIFSLCGYLLGPLISIIFCGLAIVSFFMLTSVAEYTNRYTFNSVSESLFHGITGKLIGVAAVVF